MYVVNIFHIRILQTYLGKVVIKSLNCIFSTFVFGHFAIHVILFSDRGAPLPPELKIGGLCPEFRVGSDGLLSPGTGSVICKAGAWGYLYCG